MEFRIADFEILTRHYIKYKEGIENIEIKKSSFMNQLNPLKKEMNEILKSASSGIITDNRSQAQQANRFQELQQEALKIDGDFKQQFRQMTSELNETCYNDLSEFINEYSIANNLDVVIGKMEVVFCKKGYEITDNILEMMKEKNVWVEYIELKTE